MRVLALTRYDPAGPSSRYRVYQYLPYLRAAGLEIEVAPLLDDSYVSNLYRGGGTYPLLLARALWKRLYALARFRRFDVIWLEKEVLPFVPGILERLLASLGARVVVDYDDATFHRYDNHRFPLIRAALGHKIDLVMAKSSIVVAGNEYLAARARAAGASAVQVLPTVIDMRRYSVAPPSDIPGLTIGWIGSPSTQGYLQSLSSVLAAFCAEEKARVLAVGVDPRFRLEGVPLKPVRWTEAGEVAAIQRMDVGIMPLPDSPWERGKCGFKLIQYMGCGLPVIASPVGVNSKIVTEGKTGFLATTPDQWLAALRRLAGSVELRRSLGKAGRARAEQNFSLEVAAPRLLGLLRSAVPAGRAGEGR